MSTRTGVALALALLVVASGCAALTGGGDSTGPPSADVRERYASIDTVQATQVSEVVHDGNTTTSEYRVRLDLDPPVRQFQRSVGNDTVGGSVVLVNETTTLVYDEQDREVTLIPRTETVTGQNRSSYFARVVSAARREDDTVEPSAGVSPLPVVPATSDTPSLPEQDIHGYSVDYLGEKTVADRDAHGFRLTPASDAAISMNRTVWLDAEYFYPLSTHVVLRMDGERYEVSMHLENVTFNDRIPPGTFEFDVPPNATVDRLTMPERQTFDSRAALAANASMRVPAPDVPEGYAFERGTSVSGNFTQVSLQYAGDGRLSVAKTDGTGRNVTGSLSGENVTVAGHDGRYLAAGGSVIVTWTCDDHTYTVSATTLDEQAVLDVADSVACE